VAYLRGIGDFEANGLSNCPSVENQRWAIDWKKEQGIKGRVKPIKEDATKLHCSVFNVDGHGWFGFVPEEWIERAKADPRFKDLQIKSLSYIDKFMDKLDEVVGHNFCKYDLPLLERLLGYKYPGKVTDTWSMSKTLWPDRNKDDNGWYGHGLEAWGEYFGVPKPVQEQWDTFDLDMLWRCYQDVRINTLTYDYLLEEAKKGDWTDAIDTENNVSGILGKQEATGMPFNIEGAKKLVSDWMDEQQEAYNQVRPMLSEEMDDCVGNSILDVWMIQHPTGKFKNYASTWRKLGKHKKDGGPDDPKKSPRYLDHKGETLTFLFSINQDGYRVSSKNPQMKTRDAKGKLTAEVQKFYTDPKVVGGPFTPIIYNEPDIGSDNKLRKQLLNLGWIPDKTKENEWTDTGLPRMTVKGEPVESLNTVDNVAGQILADYTVRKHRISMVVGLIGNVRADGRISAECNSGSTNTARSSHSKVVNIPGVKAKFAAKIRELFWVDKKTDDGRDWEYINTDASGLEARALAHVINDDGVTKLLCFPKEDDQGNKLDFHTFVWNKIAKFVSNRDKTKTTELRLVA